MQDIKPSSFWSNGDSITKPTPEYVGGILAGFGLGLVVATPRFGWVTPLGFLLTAIGSTLARNHQRKGQRPKPPRPASKFTRWIQKIAWSFSVAPKDYGD